MGLSQGRGLSWDRAGPGAGANQEPRWARHGAGPGTELGRRRREANNKRPFFSDAFLHLTALTTDVSITCFTLLPPPFSRLSFNNCTVNIFLSNTVDEMPFRECSLPPRPQLWGSVCPWYCPHLQP